MTSSVLEIMIGISEIILVIVLITVAVITNKDDKGGK